MANRWDNGQFCGTGIGKSLNVRIKSISGFFHTQLKPATDQCLAFFLGKGDKWQKGNTQGGKENGILHGIGFNRQGFRF
jgi:hypothetical protein